MKGSFDNTGSSDTYSIHVLSATWHYYGVIYIWQKEQECYDSRGTRVDNQSEVKLNPSVRGNIPGNGSPIMLHPRGKPFVFQLDSHGWTEVCVSFTLRLLKHMSSSAQLPTLTGDFHPDDAVR